MNLTRSDIKRVVFSKKLSLDSRALYLKIAMSPGSAYKKGFRALIREVSSYESRYKIERQLLQLIKENLIGKSKAHIQTTNNNVVTVFKALPVSQSKL